jgi:hypothetical protein
VLPEWLRELPAELAQIAALVREGALLSPSEAHWDREAEAGGRSAKGQGRATVALQTFLGLLVLKRRDGWG